MKNLKKAAIPVLVFVLFVFAAFLRAVRKYDTLIILSAQEIVIFYIYIGMIIAWGVSLWQRIMHRPIERYLLLTVLCMLFWFFARTCKNQFFHNIEPWENRFWYMYYIPMILIPLFSLFIAVHIGKQENCKLKKRYLLLFIPALLLIAGILTNELHGLAFKIWQDFEGGKDYIYGPLYYAAAGWILIMFLACIGILWHKCKLPHAARRTQLPLAVVGAGVVYCILYWIDSSNSGFGFIEMTAAYCAFTAAIWESCIVTGLIPSNTQYRAFFDFSDIGAQIVDENGSKRYFSKTAQNVSKDTFEHLKAETVFEQDGDTAIHMKPLSCGYVIWQEDLSMINRNIRELQKTEKELKKNAELLRNEINRRSHQLEVQEQIRIYNNLSVQTSRQLEKIELLLRQLENADLTQTYRILSEINVLGTYIKRRSNLILISETQEIIPTEELERCFAESIENLSLCGADCAFSARNVKTLCCEQAMIIYDLFEDITETVISSLQTLLAVLTQHGEYLCFRIQFQCNVPDKFFCSRQMEAAVNKAGGQIIYEQQADMVCVSLRLPERSA